MTEQEEDDIINQAATIKHRHFTAAEEKWKQTPDKEKNRPWPRCKNLTCNRTLKCRQLSNERCEGFEY